MTLLKNKSIFHSLALSSFEIDQNKPARQTFKNLLDSAQLTLEILNNDTLYLKEYTLYLEPMYYGTNFKSINFEMSLKHLREIINIIKQT